MTAAEQAMQSQLAGPTIALLDDMPADLWTRLSNRLSSSTAAAAQVQLPVHNCCVFVTECSSNLASVQVTQLLSSVCYFKYTKFVCACVLDHSGMSQQHFGQSGLGSLVCSIFYQAGYQAESGRCNKTSLQQMLLAPHPNRRNIKMSVRL